MARNECLDAVTYELDKAGLDYQVSHAGSGHIRIAFSTKDRNHMVTVPKTHSDWRSVKNAALQTRRTLKEAGIKPNPISVDKLYKTPKEKPVKPKQPDDRLAELFSRLEQLEKQIAKLPALEQEVHAVTELLHEIKPVQHVTVVKKAPWVPKKRGK